MCSLRRFAVTQTYDLPSPYRTFKGRGDVWLIAQKTQQTGVFIFCR
jgi:hypothetical protein